MVKVANDLAPNGSELPSGTPDPSGAGISLRAVVGLAGADGAVLHAVAERLDPLVVHTCSLADALADPARVVHRLVLAEATDLIDATDLTHAAGLADASHVIALVDRLKTADAAALTVAGVEAIEPALADALRQSARDAGLPLLLLPPGRLGQLNTAVLGALLDQQTAILSRLDTVHEALVQIVLAGGPLTDVCKRLADFEDAAIMVTSTDGRVLAEAGASSEVTWAKRLDCFDRTGRLMTEHEPIGRRSQSGLHAHRAAVPIVAGTLDHGLLVAFSSKRMLTAVDVRLLERAATVAALAITKEQAVSAVESKYRAEFLRDALAGRAGSAEEAIAHATSLGWDVDRPMVVVVAETDEDDDQGDRDADEVRFLQHRFARAWTHATAVRDIKSPVMGFSREVVAVLGVTEPVDTDRIMRAVGELVRVVSGDGGGGRRSFSTGVSRPIASITDLPRAYDEALNAVAVGRQMNGHGALTHVDGLGIYRLLALIPDSAQLRRFVDDALGPLATDASPDNADLRETLRLLIDTNMNVAETARLLFFHYNTLRYRITKLEKMLGPFTDDPELRLTLALALKVHQMRGL